jgi:hypothetical protein
MKRNPKSMRRFLLAAVLFVALPATLAGPVAADENLHLYGGKGYHFMLSPLVANGLHAQTGALYGSYHENNLECRDGYIWALPFSLTYGDGDWWEASVATHLERWKNTDFDHTESGLGDLYLGAKFRVLGQDRGGPLDLAMNPYLLIPTGDRDQEIADLYRWVQTDDGKPAWGLDLLLGRRWDRFYASVQLGVNVLDTDDEFVDDTALYYGIAAEYQLTESLLAYLEFFSTQNKNSFTCEVCSPCYDPKIGRDIRELGGGVAWLRGPWGFKAHLGTGFTETSPDVRVSVLINRGFGR